MNLHRVGGGRLGGRRDANGQALANVNFEDEPGRRTAANLLSRDEARRIVANIAEMPQYRRDVASRGDFGTIIVG